VIGLVTPQARAMVAELEKRKKAEREEPQKPGCTPLHAMAEGEAEYDEEQRREREASKARHPSSGRFVADQRHPILTDDHAADSPGNGAPTPRPMISWPGTEAHNATVRDLRLTQVGNSRAPMPEPHAVVHDLRGEDHPERAMHFGLAQVNHLDLGGRPHIVGPLPLPAQPADYTASNSPGSTQ
jgi:hypothetical protein